MMPQAPKKRQSAKLTNKVAKAPTAKRSNVKRTRNAGSKRHVAARQREATAIDLRLKGLSYQAIGDKLGVSNVTAYNAVMRVLEGIEHDLEEKAPRARQLELQRLDGYLKALEPRTKKGDVKAIDAALKICNTRCRILGIYAPEEIKHSGEVTVFHEMSDAAIDLELQALLSQVPELKQLAVGLGLLPPTPRVIDTTGEPVHVNGKATNGKAE